MTLLNTVDTYSSLQPFESVEQLNENTILIREQFADQMTESAKKVLDVLHRYSCKFPGVCYLSKGSIAEMIGVSRRTVIRACKALEEFGVIVQYELKRRNGDRRQSSNAIVFVSVEPTKEKAKETTMSHRVSHRHTLSKTHLKSSNTLDTAKQDSPDKSAVNDFSKEKDVDNVDNFKNDTSIVKAEVKRGMRSKIPEYIYDVLAPYFNLDDLYQAYGALLRGKAYIDNTIQFEAHEDLFRNAVLSVINAYKRGVVRNIYAVMYAAARDTTAQIYRQENYNKNNIVADYIKGLF